MTNNFHPNEEVTHYYVKMGRIVVNYLDEKGNPLKEQVEDTQKSRIGTKYDTTDNRPEVIEKDGKIYERVPDKTVGKENGKVVGGTTVVTYVYKEVVKPESTPVEPTAEIPSVEPTAEIPKQDSPTTKVPKLESPKKSPNIEEPIKSVHPNTHTSKTLEKMEKKEDDKPKTGEGNMIYALATIGIASAAGILLVRRKKQKEC